MLQTISVRKINLDNFKGVAVVGAARQGRGWQGRARIGEAWQGEGFVGPRLRGTARLGWAC